MRTAAIALACLVAAAAPCRAADPLQFDVPPGAPGKAKVAPVEQHASIPDGKPVQRVRDGRPPRGRQCFSEAETREKIAVHRLSDPVAMLRLGRFAGDALSAKLCRWSPGEFVYEIHLLRADGRLLRVYMNAATGESMNGQTSSDWDKDRK